MDLYNETGDLFYDIIAYVFARYSTSTTDRVVLKELNQVEALEIPLKNLSILFRNKLVGLKENLNSFKKLYPEYKDYLFFIEEALYLQAHQMNPQEEDLANHLSQAGGEAWSRLHSTLASTISEIWDEKTGETKTVNQLRALAFHADRNIRQKAWKQELTAWKKFEIPLAYALNGVKGFTNELDQRRKYPSTIDRSLFQTRISRKTLDALISTLYDARKLLQRYLKGKAKLLGLQSLSFYDIFAPAIRNAKEWQFSDAKDFIIHQFNNFSPELGKFAGHAFQNQWIDAEPRQGKMGGAFCESFPLSGDSRILCNFDGSFSAVSTIAHELGHAYHHHILKDSSHIKRDYPLTLAETASIFCETLIFQNAMKEVDGEEKLNIIEVFLSESTQVIVDILSRFIFESKIIEKRKNNELTPEEFCSLMIDAQKETYGTALNEEELHPYMWAVKGHYYQQDSAFYNYPYAFGQLFGISLYQQYIQEGQSFISKYDQILQKTGMSTAVDIIKEVGFNIEEKSFWQSSIEVIRSNVEAFEKLVG
ncbi:MAG: M3 family oligoendopeptidase [Spirochaetes bacterium]|nr:M3 family oligoendopeptidase [Spirochaetota bacterium]